MDIHLLQITAWFGLAGALLYLSFFRLFPAPAFRQNRRAIVMGVSLFWPGFAIALVGLARGDDYGFFYPGG